jgi:hypothetical protein
LAGRFRIHGRKPWFWLKARILAIPCSCGIEKSTLSREKMISTGEAIGHPIDWDALASRLSLTGLSQRKPVRQDFNRDSTARKHSTPLNV